MKKIKDKKKLCIQKEKLIKYIRINGKINRWNKKLNFNVNVFIYFFHIKIHNKDFPKLLRRKK